MAVAGMVVGPDAPNRQVVVRIPSSDERAAAVLKAEAKQLPEDGPGLVMVNTNRQPSAFTSWPDLVRGRFASKISRLGFDCSEGDSKPSSTKMVRLDSHF